MNNLGYRRLALRLRTGLLLTFWAWFLAGAANPATAATTDPVTDAPSPATLRQILVPAGSTWRYLVDGTDLKEAWRAPAFSDAQWSSGAAQLGYGDGDEKTVIGKGQSSHPITAYFRTEFQVPADLTFSGLAVRLVRDDGAVVYLNGKELLRDNLPDGAITFSTLANASTPEENAFRLFLVNPAALVPGRNVLAVELHQVVASSADASFDLELTGILARPTTALPVVSVEATRPATSEPMPTARIAPGQITLRRTGSTDKALAVFLDYGGTAEAAKDYTELGHIVVIPAGKSELALEVIALDDERIEGTETVVARLIQPPIVVGPTAIPGFWDVFPGLNYTVDPAHDSAEVTIHDADLPKVATLIIDAPKAGDRFPEGTSITVAVVAVDPQGYINKVEFLADDQSIGTSAIEFIRAPDPGTPIHHEVVWKNAPAGTHKLSARAVSSSGARVSAAVIPIEVTAADDRVVLEISASDAIATEPSSNGSTDPAVFVIRRVAGKKDVAVPVWYNLGGTAENGVDYAKLTGRAELPKGAESVEIVVRPQADRLVEGDETIEVKLADAVCAEIFPPLPQCYRIGASAAAKAVLKDLVLGAATLAIKEPTEGARFEAGTTIPILAVAVDPRGYISRVEFYDGDTRIGVSELTFIRAPDPGTPIEHRLEWKGAAAGEHKLNVRARGSDGAALTSAPIRVHVTGKPDPTEPWLVNVNFGLGAVKKGPAATGIAASDYWNPWEFVYQPDVTVKSLRLASGDTGPVSLRVRNAGGSWNNRSGDAMYDSYVYPNSGRGDGVGEVQVTLTDVPVGKYDLYLYGHADPDGRPESDSVFTAAAGDRKFGPLGTSASAGWKAEAGWKEGAQYIVFRGVEVAADGTVEIVVEPGFNGGNTPNRPAEHVAILNGLQLRRVASTTAITGKLAITAPEAGASLPAGVPVEVKIEATDTKGGITRVELFDGSTSLGVSEITFIKAPEPGVPIVHTIVWKAPSNGSHSLVARAKDTAGNAIASAAVRVTVKANQPPKVALTSPSSGAVFLTGDTIVAKAEASDPDGAIARLDIFDGEILLGSAKGATLSVEWKTATAGLHKLSAHAVDDGGREAHSGVVPVLVQSAADLAFVRRDLPPAYLPGATLEVTLVAEPGRSAKAWTAEDHPPAGWKVTEITHQGVFDAVTGKVKFGPFTDTTERRLTYQVTAPTGASGVQKFAGSSSADGKSYPIAGESELAPAGPFHPADVRPEDKSLSADELTTYAAAWKVGKGWGSDASPIPLAYVTRAGQIWKRGEAYRFDPTLGAPPECWAPLPPKTSAFADASVGAGKSNAGAVRQAAMVWKPGRADEVKIVVVPPAGAVATAIEECVPVGWNVRNVGSGGTFDAAAARVRWGLVYGATPFEVSYELVPPSGTATTVELRGKVSFDGALATIDGRTRAGAADESTVLRIAGSRRDEKGHLHLRVESAADQVFVIEASSDLVNWSDVGLGVQTGAELPVEDPNAVGSAPRYYRLRPIGH